MNTVTETELAAKSTAPRITSDDIEASIASEHYFSAADGVYGNEANNARPHTATLKPLLQVTVCVLLLHNGHKIVGVNEGPVSDENFDFDIGRRYARAAATKQIWPLLGYQLKERLYQSTQPANAPE